MNVPNEATRYVEPEQLRSLVAQGAGATIVDVRSAEEFAAGYVEGAVNIPPSKP
jgi:rhodanese-related sulfurtransferase